MQFNIAKKTSNFFGGSNVYVDESNKSIFVISKVNRKNPVYYFLNILLVFLLFLFSFLLVSSLISNGIGFSIIFSFLLIVLMLSIYSALRIKEGDTIIATEDGIRELNWLFSRFIKWGDVVKVYFYPEGEFSRKFPWLKIYFDITWTNIKVRGHRKTIRVSTKFSNNEQLQKYIRSKCRGKTEERKYEPLYFLIMMIAAIFGALLLYIFRPFKGLIE